MSACIQGDRRAQNELYKLCYGPLMSVCTRYKSDRDEAAAALNVGFLKILQNLNRYNKKAPFIAWIKRIMINTMIDDYRKGKKEKLVDHRDFSEPQYDVEGIDFNQADLQFDADQILELIEELPTMTKRVFNLYAIDGYSHKEISKMLDMSDGTSKWHLSNARKKLKAKLKSRLGIVKE
ncbi:MAG: RNA polymerase sigma factor [Bacteroidia bacterium]|nr:RNA polymerase sigma factor [Bacteroidia bacterium]